MRAAAAARVAASCSRGARRRRRGAAASSGRGGDTGPHQGAGHGGAGPGFSSRRRTTGRSSIPSANGDHSRDKQEAEGRPRTLPSSRSRARLAYPVDLKSDVWRAHFLARSSWRMACSSRSLTRCSPVSSPRTATPASRSVSPPCAPMRDGGHGVGPRRAATRGGGAGLRRAWRR